MDEIWKDIPGYEGLYMVSNAGRVKSCKRFTTSGKIIKQHRNNRSGYMTVSLSKNNIKTTKRVHVLVMNAFCPVAKKQGYDRNFTIDHIDGNKENNMLTNLEWCTQSENQKRAFKNGLNGIHGTKCIDLDTLEVFETLTDAARSVGSERAGAVLRVCNGMRSQYRNHRFAYYYDYENDKIPEFIGKFKKRSSEGLWR